MPQIPLVFNSQSSNARQLSPYKNHFSVQFNPPISIPVDAKNCTVALVNASIWNNFINIGESYNNHKFRYYNGTTWFSETFTDGLYTIDDISAEIKRIVVRNGGTGTEIVLDPSFSTGILSVILPANWSIDWTNNGENNTFRFLVGFNDPSQDTITSTGTAISALKVANFSAVSNIAVHSSFGSMNTDGKSSDILSSFPLTSKPSILNFFEPLFLLRTDASKLVGTKIQDAYFRLTDQDDYDLICQDEFTLTVVIEYE